MSKNAVFKLLNSKVLTAIQVQDLFFVQEREHNRINMVGQALQEGVEHDWRRHSHTLRALEVTGIHLFENPASHIHETSGPSDSLIVFNAKEHLPLNAWRISEDFPEVLVDSLNDD